MTDQDRNAELIPRSLLRSWLAGSTVGAAVLLLGAGLLARWLGPAAGGRWLVVAAASWVYLSLFLRRRLGRVRRRPDGELLGDWGPGTWLSVLRAICISALAGFLLLPRPKGWLAWLPMALYTVSDISDYFDGYLARRSDRVTLLGIDLDLELDALGLFVAVLLAVLYGTLSPLFLPIGLARYAFAALVGIRRRLGRPVHDLPPSSLRRPIAGLTMGFVSATLWPILGWPEANLAAVVFMVPFGVGFLRDGLVVAGVVDHRSDDYVRVRNALRGAALTALPVLLRPLFAAAVLLEVRRLWVSSADLSTGLMAWGIADPQPVVIGFALLEAVGALALLLGWAGRLAAFALLFPIGLTITASVLDPTRAVLLAIDLILLLTGTGPLSLWKPADDWFRRPAGAQREST